MKTFEEFCAAMETDEELKAKASALFGDVTDEQAKIDLLVKFAVENGYDVSVEDFTRVLAERRELSEEELKLVAGGDADYLSKGFCYLIWHVCAYNVLV